MEGKDVDRRRELCLGFGWRCMLSRMIGIWRNWEVVRLILCAYCS